MPRFENPVSYTGQTATKKRFGESRFATQAEANAGSVKGVSISPSTLNAAVNSLVSAASETVVGVAELATQAETNTGTDNTRIVTALKLKTNLASPPSIGGTAPAAGVFTTLSATGATTGVAATFTGLLTASAGQVSNVTVITDAASPYAVLASDYLISTNSTAAVITVTLPVAPTEGRKVIVYDGAGQAAVNNITISGNGKNIASGGASAASATLSSAYGSIILTYSGTIWLGQAIA